jgi:hypothetical protein
MLAIISIFVFTLQGTCKRGDMCPYAHGVFECWLHPSRYRTQMCKDAPKCTRRVCFFAHDCSELREPDPADKEALELTIAMNGGSDTTGEDT